MANQAAIEPKQENASLGLVIKDQQQTEVHFKVKPSTKFEKIFKVYCEKKGLELTGVKFLFDGTRLLPHQTPAEVEMEDGDSVDCLIEQIGGAAAAGLVRRHLAAVVLW